MSDPEILELIGKDALKGQRALFDRYFSYVSAIVFSRLRSCGSREDIDECVSDVFCRIFKDIDSGTVTAENLKACIGTSARNHAVDYYRRLERHNRHITETDEEALSALSDGIDIAADTERSDMRSKLIAAIEGLGEPDSTIVMEKYYYGKTSGQISALVSLTPDAVRMRCSRAVKKLRSSLEEYGITL